MSRRFRHWLIGIAGLLLVLGMVPLNDRLLKAHPSVLWAEMVTMGAAMIVAQYRNELRRRG